MTLPVSEDALEAEPRHGQAVRALEPAQATPRRRARGAAVAAGAAGLRVEGPVFFSQAGTAMIAPGETSVDVRTLSVRARSAVLATVQGTRRGYSVSARRVNDHTIRLSISRPAPSRGLRVAYFVVN